MNLRGVMMTKEMILKHMNDAIALMNECKKNPMLRKVYSDFDFYKFINRCKNMLDEEFHDIDDIEIPFTYRQV